VRNASRANRQITPTASPGLTHTTPDSLNTTCNVFLRANNAGAEAACGVVEEQMRSLGLGYRRGWKVALEQGLSGLGLGVCALALVSCATGAKAPAAGETPAPTKAAGGTPKPKGYELQPGDIIRISVWQEDQGQQQQQPILVRPDGGISYPLAGNVQAAGRTVEKLTEIIAKRLAKYIPNPVVTVTLDQIPGNRIYILGRVNKPGDYVISRDVTVMQALAMAGGLTPFADRGDIKILRTDSNGRQVPIPFNYGQAEEGEHLGQNIPLRAGDVIVVP
jgi:polysaccharide export outer membrane protein